MNSEPVASTMGGRRPWTTDEQNKKYYSTVCTTSTLREVDFFVTQLLSAVTDILRNICIK